MKRALISFLILGFSTIIYAQSYTYQSVSGDPMGTRVYTLSNGLRVYLSVNKDEPRINTKIAVRAGSKNDPSDCTGLAHYLEHMLFKGNSKIASKDWNKESVLIKQISDLYEKHKQTTDPSQKKKIYQQIDSISQIAAAYAIPNEYDKMVSSIGASGTNAYTSNEETVYVNEIPSNELEKWLFLESERFSELTLRLFHTELEAVYEEYNRMMDKDFSRAFLAFNELLYQKHPYGTQHTIGKGEHLKNPSMVKIHEYFDQYYVPNNMAIVLVGDLEYEATVALIDKYFGKAKSKTVPGFSFIPEDPITKPLYREIYGPQSEAVLIGFRLPGVDSQEANYLRLMDYMLNNSTAGLIDLNLIQKQKVLNAGCGTSIDKDYSTLYFYGIPKEGQTLDEVKQLILDQIENLKKGAFDPQLLAACQKNMLLDREKGIEDNAYRSAQLVESFIFDRSWQTMLEDQSSLQKITLAELQAFVQKNFNTNYVEVRKLQGKDNESHKVEKPKITPLSITRDEQSSFAKGFYAISSQEIVPNFINFEEEIEHGTVKNKIPVDYVFNGTNRLFNLELIYDMGSHHDPLLSLAISYLDYLGTDKYSAEEFKKTLFYEGLSLSYHVSSDQLSIHLSGIESSMSKGIDLMENILNQAVVNPSIYQEMVEDILKSRKDAKKDKATILQSALKNYAMYGKKSPFTDILSEKELRAISPDSLVQKIKNLKNLKHRFYYYGPQTLFNTIVNLHEKHQRSFVLKDVPSKKQYPYREVKESEVYFVDYDMLQSELLFISKSAPYSLDLMPMARLHNNYFGGGLSSIVFQEIRESKALAYAARNTFSVPADSSQWCFNSTYIGTQADKLPDALQAMQGLLNQMPMSEKQFQDAKDSELKQMATNRTPRKGIFALKESAYKMGLDYDYRRTLYQKTAQTNIQGLQQFHQQYIQGKPSTYLVIGKKQNVDFKSLEKLGPVKELSLEEIFGY